MVQSRAVTWLSAGLHVFGPVCLLTGVITVAGVPAAVEDSLLSAVSTPLFLLCLIHCLLLLEFRLLLYFRHQPLSLLFQALPHFCHCKLYMTADKTQTDKTKWTHCFRKGDYTLKSFANWLGSHQDCASFLTTLADAATVIFLFRFSGVWSELETGTWS